MSLKEQCHELAGFWRRRVFVDSLQKALEIVYDPPVEHEELVETSRTGKELINVGVKANDRVQLAHDKDGFFAVVVGKKYYPVPRDQYLLGQAELYESLESSSSRRVIQAFEIAPFYYTGYPFVKTMYHLQDTMFLMWLLTAGMADAIGSWLTPYKKLVEKIDAILPSLAKG